MFSANEVPSSNLVEELVRIKNVALPGGVDFPRHRLGCLGDAGTRGRGGLDSPCPRPCVNPLVASQPRRSRRRLGHPV